MEQKLTIEDFDILIEAVDSWRNRSLLGETLGDLTMRMLITDKEQRKKFEEDHRKEKADKEQKKEIEKEKAEFLKAKLVMMKREIYKKELESIKT